MTLIAWELDSSLPPGGTEASAPGTTDLWVCPQPGGEGDRAERGSLRRAWVVATEAPVADEGVHGWVDEE